MVIRRKKPDEDEEYWEEEYETSFKQASKESDNSLLFIGGMAGLLAVTSLAGTLTPSEMELVSTEYGITTEIVTETVQELDTITSILPGDAINSIEQAVTPSSEELTHLNQMMEEAKQYGRMNDPKTAENLTFSNQSRIAEQVGQFGYHESSIQGNLNVAAMEGVMFPWVTQGDDHVCEECDALEAEGPYPADNYPEVPHYGCRCNEPFPEPIVALAGAVEKIFKRVMKIFKF